MSDDRVWPTSRADVTARRALTGGKVVVAVRRISENNGHVYTILTANRRALYGTTFASSPSPVRLRAWTRSLYHQRVVAL